MLSIDSSGNITGTATVAIAGEIAEYEMTGGSVGTPAVPAVLGTWKRISPVPDDAQW